MLSLDGITSIHRKLDKCSTDTFIDKCLRWFSELSETIGRSRNRSTLEEAVILIERLLRTSVKIPSLARDVSQRVIPDMIKCATCNELSDNQDIVKLNSILIRIYPNACSPHKKRLIDYCTILLKNLSSNDLWRLSNLPELLSSMNYLNVSKKETTQSYLIEAQKGTIKSIVTCLSGIFAFVDVTLPTCLKDFDNKYHSLPYQTVTLNGKEGVMHNFYLFNVYCGVILQWMNNSEDKMPLLHDWLHLFCSVLELFGDRYLFLKMQKSPEFDILERICYLSWETLRTLISAARGSFVVNVTLKESVWRIGVDMLRYSRKKGYPTVGRFALRIVIYQFFSVYIRAFWHLELDYNHHLKSMIKQCELDLKVNEVDACESPEAGMDAYAEVTYAALCFIEETLSSYGHMLDLLATRGNRGVKRDVIAPSCMSVIMDVIVSQSQCIRAPFDNSFVLKQLCITIASVLDIVGNGHEITMPSHLLPFLNFAKTLLNASDRMVVDCLIKRIRLMYNSVLLRCNSSSEMIVEGGGQSKSLHVSDNESSVEEDAVEEDIRQYTGMSGKSIQAETLEVEADEESLEFPEVEELCRKRRLELETEKSRSLSDTDSKEIEETKEVVASCSYVNTDSVRRKKTKRRKTDKLSEISVSSKISADKINDCDASPINSFDNDGPTLSEMIAAFDSGGEGD